MQFEIFGLLSTPDTFTGPLSGYHTKRCTSTNASPTARELILGYRMVPSMTLNFEVYLRERDDHNWPPHANAFTVVRIVLSRGSFGR